jgi:uncharacterized protein YjlB
MLRLSPNGWVPNNPGLPVVIYRNAIHHDLLDLAGEFETLFAANGWIPDWRGTVHDQHHFHSSAHEVLGVNRGSAILMLGGPGGPKISLDETDALFLPAGTGHCRLRGSGDFQVVAAYPPNQSWNLCSGDTAIDRTAEMLALEIPDTDPVLGLPSPVCAASRPTGIGDA